MRKMIILLALLTSSALFIAATPSPASAANCTASTTNIWWTGQFSYQALLSSCTQVNAVQFYDGSTSYPAFIWDASVGLRHNASSGGGYIYLTAGSYITTYGVSNWGLWCPGNVHTVSSYFLYRIRNAVGNTWGSLHQYGGTRYEQIC